MVPLKCNIAMWILVMWHTINTFRMIRKTVILMLKKRFSTQLSMVNFHNVLECIQAGGGSTWRPWGLPIPVKLIQWRIQDFPYVGVPTRWERVSMSDIVTFRKKCMSKWENLDPQEAAHASQWNHQDLQMLL